MITTVPMYRVVCDAEGCEDSPSDDGEFYAWKEADGALDDLDQADDWWTNEAKDKHLCPDHAPTCPAENCGMSLMSDEFGQWCEDHAPEEPNP